MAIKTTSTTLAALAAAFAGSSFTLGPVTGNLAYQHSHRDSVASYAEEQAQKEAEGKIAERKKAEASEQQEAAGNIVRQSSQLQFLYTYYIWMEICAERFAQFDSTKAALREVLRSKEDGIPSERIERLWNMTAEKFQQLEGVLMIAGEGQMYTDCDQNSRYVEGLLMLASQMAGPSRPPPRKKDF